MTVQKTTKTRICYHTDACTDQTYLHSRHLYVVQYAPDAPVTGEPDVGVDGEEVIHRPRHVDTQGNTLTEGFEETRSDGHHVEA